MQQNYDFFLGSELDKYSGKWVAIVDKKIICAGKKIKKVYDKAQKLTSKRAFISKVPKKALSIPNNFFLNYFSLITAST